MKRKLIIFGSGDIAELAYFYFKNQSIDYQVVAFTVDDEYLDNRATIDDLPVFPFKDIEKIFPPSEYDAFVAISYSCVNKTRASKYFELKNKGYKLASFISPKISNYALSIGDNCFILEDNTIQPFVEIGNNVTLWSGNHIGHHSSIKDHCFISSHVVISGGCTIGSFSFIGVNATLRDHITLGESNIIGAGTLILSNTSDCSVYIGEESRLSKVPSHKLKKI